MNVDALKITVLRASRPGDIVFLQIRDNKEFNSQMMSALESVIEFTKTKGVTLIVLPEQVCVVGTLFTAPAGVVPPYKYKDVEVPS